jgi:hypothetical protein
VHFGVPKNFSVGVSWKLRKICAGLCHCCAEDLIHSGAGDVAWAGSPTLQRYTM